MKKVKRILALLLCITMVAACWPSQRSKAAETPDVTTYTLNETKTTVYAKEYFSTQTKYESALGDYAGHSYGIPWSEEGLLVSSGQKNAIFDGVSQNYISNLQNYSVSADIVTTQTTGNVGVMINSRSANKTSSNSYGYEFNILGTTSGQTFRLNRRLVGTVYTFAPTAGNNSGVAITNYFADYTPGEKITLKISATINEEGNVVLNCEATYKNVTKTIFKDIVDNTSSKVTAGAPGLKINKANAKVTKISVVDATGNRLYEDDFSSQTNYENALGNQVGHSYGTTWTEDGLISSTGTQNAIFNGILNNYTISADVKTTQTTGNVAIMVNSRTANQTSSDSYGYEFHILGTSSGQTFRLNRRLKSTVYTFAPTAGNNNGVAITQFFANYTPGETITLIMDVSNNEAGNVVLNCYAIYKGERKTIFANVVDQTDKKVTMGAPGVKVNKANATVSNITVATYEKATNYLYQDDFAGSNGYVQAAGDYNGSKFAYQTGYLVKGPNNTWETKFNGITNSAALTDYTMSADMSFGFGSGKYHRITAYGAKDKGYEFGLIQDTKIGASFSLYRRGSSASSFDGAVAISDFFTADNGSFSEDVFRLSMSMKNESDGVRIVCFATYNGVTKEIFNVLDNSAAKYTSGVPGIRCNDNTYPDKVKVDNICVTKVSASAEPTPEPVDITIPFTETFDRTNNQLASYWNNGQDLVVQNVDDNKQAVLGGNVKNLYLTGDKDTLDWTDYVYEVDVTMLEEADVDRDQSFASIIAGVNGSNQGYEFALMYVKSKDKGYVRLYDRIHGTTIKTPAFDFEFGEKVTLKMVVTEYTIKCYANDELLITADGLEDVKGTVGLSILGKKAIFDNISVKNIPTPEDIKLPFAEDFEGTKSDLVTLWNKGETVTIETEDDNKQLVLDGTETSIYLTGSQNAKTWSNYVYEAEVTMGEEFNSSIDSSVATIVASANSSNKGYELSLMYVKSKDAYYLRLYNRIQGTAIKSPAFDFEFGIPVLLKMEVGENTIKCYANGELLITATGLNNLSGTIGMAAAGRCAKFDNVSVTQYIKETVVAPSADDKGVYYRDNFNESVVLDDNKWSDEVLNISDEQAVVSGDKGILALQRDAGYLLLSDYSVFAKVVIGEENDSYAKDTVGALVARSTGDTTGYELGIIFSGESSYVRLYDRTSGKVLAKNTDFTFEKGKEYQLAMVCDGDSITCYVDGKKAIAVNDTTNQAGSVSLRTIGTVYYDDLVVATPAYASNIVTYVPNVNSPATGDVIAKNIALYSALFVVTGALVVVEIYDLKRRKNSVKQ